MAGVRTPISFNSASIGASADGSIKCITGCLSGAASKIRAARRHNRRAREFASGRCGQSIASASKAARRTGKSAGSQMQCRRARPPRTPFRPRGGARSRSVPALRAICCCKFRGSIAREGFMIGGGGLERGRAVPPSFAEAWADLSGFGRPSHGEEAGLRRLDAAGPAAPALPCGPGRSPWLFHIRRF